MMNPKRKTRLLLSLALCAAAGPTFASDPGSVAGHWRFQDDVAGIHKDRNCTFTQKEAAFAGTCRDADGPVSVTGRVSGDKITFQYKVAFSGQELTIACSGTLKGDNGSGSVEAQPLGIPGSFTLTRSK